MSLYGCRRHLFLVAEGFIFFALALVEVLSFQVPAVRNYIPTFRAIDQSIGTPKLLPSHDPLSTS